MIKEIQLQNVATYSDLVQMFPACVNYIYGSNGSGKTTFSKVIANPEVYEDCKLIWSDQPLETLVYNKKFVDENFEQSNTIKGIFTLGKNSVSTYSSIVEAKERIDFLSKEIGKANRSSQVLGISIDEENNKIFDLCWLTKLKYETWFKPAFTGYIGSKKAFFDKCIIELKNNSSKILTVEEITKKCDHIYANVLKLENTIPPFEVGDLLKLENNPILNTSIVGKDNSQIGLFIKNLSNSDWVAEGMKHLRYSNNQCPFCQQDLPVQFEEELNLFFDETYSIKCREVVEAKNDYISFMNLKIEQLRNIAREKISVIEINKLTPKVQLLQQIIDQNVLIFDSKIKSPSISVNLISSYDIFMEIKEIVSDYIEVINRNNSVFYNLNTERKNLKDEVWRFISQLLKKEIDLYLNAVDGKFRGIENIKNKITQYEVEKNELWAKIKGWESEVTNVTHTINEINKILKLFSFHNFSLAEASEKGFYKIIREDGSEAHSTLSEGEYRFITFLYFYHLLNGSIQNSGAIVDRVVVFDDPISSLDSSVLFVVSGLIKDLIVKQKKQNTHIKQIFILTHNIYFYKEVTFRGSRYNISSSEDSYWIVRKINNKSTIRSYKENPVKTSYELLWREISDVDNVNKATIFNTMRRILEYYFNIIGGLDYEKCINEFEGEEKIICKSLVSWVNDGSHFISDDLMVHIDDDEVQKYISVFKCIFQKMDHISHYEMMIKRYSSASV